jgi:hypothetical protein
MRCARLSDQTKVLAWFCVAFDCRLCAQLLDAERNLAFRIPGHLARTPHRIALGAPPAIERRARSIL